MLYSRPPTWLLPHALDQVVSQEPIELILATLQGLIHRRVHVKTTSSGVVYSGSSGQYLIPPFSIRYVIFVSMLSVDVVPLLPHKVKADTKC